MELKEIIKNTTSGWEKREIFTLLFFFGFILVNAVCLHDNIIAVISAICGISYTVLVGKGKVAGFFFGLLGSGCYAYLALKNELFGNALLYLFYYIPMQSLGIFRWLKHINPDSQDIIKTSLNRKEAIILSFLTLIATIITVYILVCMHDSNPFVDGITTIFSILGMYLTVKRCVEQWVVWTIVNGLSLLMWVNVIASGTKVYSTVIMWAAYFVIGIYFYFVWSKELKE